MGELRLELAEARGPRRRRREAGARSPSAGPPRAARTRRRCSTPGRDRRRARATTATRWATQGSAAGKRRRRGGDRRLHRPGPRPGRVRGQGVAGCRSKRAIEELDQAIARARRRLRRLVVPVRGAAPGQDAGSCARTTATSCSSCFDPEDGSGLLARGRLLAGAGPRADGPRRGRGDRRDGDPRGDRARGGAMGDVRRIKQQITSAKTSIDRSTDILDAMAAAVRAQLMHVELLLAAAGELGRRGRIPFERRDLRRRSPAGGGAPSAGGHHRRRPTAARGARARAAVPRRPAAALATPVARQASRIFTAEPVRRTAPL